MSPRDESARRRTIRTKTKCYHRAVPDGPETSLNASWATSALESLEEGVIVVDAAGVVVFHNAAAMHLVGVDAPAPDVRDWSAEYGCFEVDEKTPMPTERLPIVRALGGEVLADACVFVRNPTRPKGVHFSVSARPIRGPEGEIRGATAIFRDVTERRRRDSDANRVELQKRALLDNIPDIAWLKDREGRYLAVNLALAEAMGYARPEEIEGLTDFDLWPRERAEAYKREDDEVIRTGQHIRVEESFTDAKQRVMWIETFKTRIVGDDGVVLGTTGIARDITDRRRADETLRNAKDELERRVQLRSAELAEAQESLVRKERLAVLGQLAGGVAHQIRNPLAAIMNATYVLRRHLTTSHHANVDDALRIIHDEVRHANVIITSLLDYARVRSPDRHPTALGEIVERVLAAEVVSDNVLVEKTIEDVPPLEVDANQIHGALVNLVRNAVEAMPEGGKLGIELSVRDGEVLLAVVDSGCGISPARRTHLFEPLQSTKPLGIGLGLVTARTFVEAHGGRIVCVDVPRGARFEIRLPL